MKQLFYSFTLFIYLPLFIWFLLFVYVVCFAGRRQVVRGDDASPEIRALRPDYRDGRETMQRSVGNLSRTIVTTCSEIRYQCDFFAFCVSGQTNKHLKALPCRNFVCGR